MATSQPTRVCADRAAQIDLLSAVETAKINIEIAAAAIEAAHRAGLLPRDVYLISQYLAEASCDLEDRTRAALEDEGGPHVG